MRKAASILLLALLAFNWVGYRLVSSWLETRSTVLLEKQINNKQYADADLIEFRIPLNTPYLTGSSAEFERYDGEVEINGVHYHYVKRKVENGELTLLCLPNDTKQKIQHSSVAFFKLINDVGRPEKGKETGNSGALKNFIAECRQEDNNWSVARPAIRSEEMLSADRFFVSYSFGRLPEHPPQA